MLLTTKEKIMDTDVTLRFVSNTAGHEVGDVVTWARTEFVDGLIKNGHVRVVAERPAPVDPVEPPADELKPRRGPRKPEPDTEPADG